jgi:hypothetical protein
LARSKLKVSREWKQVDWLSVMVKQGRPTAFEARRVLFSEEGRKKPPSPMPWHPFSFPTLPPKHAAEPPRPPWGVSRQASARAGCLPASSVTELTSVPRAAAAYEARLRERCQYHGAQRKPFAHLLNARIQKAAAAQSVASPPGLKWVRAGMSRPSEGRELCCEKLARALERKTEFTVKEWNAFGIVDLRHDDFISSADSYFRPASPDEPRCPCSRGLKFACRLHIGPVRSRTSSRARAGQPAGALTLQDCLLAAGRER